MHIVKFTNSLLFVSSVIKAVMLPCVFKMYSDSSDLECFSYADPYQPNEYLSRIKKLTCRMFNTFYSALFSDQGEVEEVNKEISYGG